MSLPPKSPLLQIEHVEGVAVVKVAASLLDDSNIQAIGADLFAVADAMACPRLRLDLAQVQFLSSTVLGKLMALHKRVRAAGGNLTLVNVSDLLYEVFDVTRLVQILDVHRGPGDLPSLAS